MKRWSPAARLEGGKPHGYMVGDKEGSWYFASTVAKRIAKLRADKKALLDALKERRTIGGSHLGCIVGPSKDYRCDMCKRTDVAITEAEKQ